MSKRPFTKPHLSACQHVDALRRRGLNIPAPDTADHYLNTVGYYRLSAYFKPFEAARGADGFTAGTSFEDVLDLYIFDRKLRLQCMDGLERVEIAFRAILSNTLSDTGGPHWFLSRAYFSDAESHRRQLEVIRRDICHDGKRARHRPPHIQHYYETYCDPEMPPSWMVFESLSFGTASHIYRALNKDHKRSVAQAWGLPLQILQSWAHAMTVLRNICAHHGRLWNRHFAVAPATYQPLSKFFQDNNTFYTQAMVLKLMLDYIAPGHQWHERLEELLQSCPHISPGDMGFPARWKRLKPWL